MLVKIVEYIESSCMYLEFLLSVRHLKQVASFLFAKRLEKNEFESLYQQVSEICALKHNLMA